MFYWWRIMNEEIQEYGTIGTDEKIYYSKKHGFFYTECYNCGNKHSEFIKYCEKCGIQINPREENDQEYKERKNKFYDVLNVE